GIPEKNIILEVESLNTRQQGVNVMEIVKEEEWKRIIIVASHYHQYRAFLTFLQARKKAHAGVDIINGWVKNLSWTKPERYGRRIDLLKNEFDRIEEYQQKGDVASFKEGIDYLLAYDKNL
ncbi:MAG: YdcF family protein, partial [Candidatus Portnoybacteria bacterium]|nr:YdcF family protein [Candidatus Portnoybacteria bacterium]